MTVANGSDPKDTGPSSPQRGEGPGLEAPAPDTDKPRMSDIAAGYAEKQDFTATAPTTWTC